MREYIDLNSLLFEKEGQLADKVTVHPRFCSADIRYINVLHSFHRTVEIFYTCIQNGRAYSDYWRGGIHVCFLSLLFLILLTPTRFTTLTSTSSSSKYGTDPVQPIEAVPSFKISSTDLSSRNHRSTSLFDPQNKSKLFRSLEWMLFRSIYWIRKL